MATDYSGYNPDPTKGAVGATWKGGGWNPTVGDYTISGPMAGTSGGTLAGVDINAKPTDAKPEDTDTPAGDDPYTAFLKKQAAEQERLRTMNAIAAMSGIMSTYGLSSLMDKIKGWVTDGYEADAIMGLIRDTSEYKARFPAMEALAKKNRAMSEAEYISYEQTAAHYESLFGLPEGMLTGKDMVTKLLSNEVSARELEERATKASAAQYELPPEFRTMMQDYYNIGSGGLTAYYLDPDVAAPLLERQFVSSQIGMEAALKGLGVGVDTAEYLYQQGVDRARAQKGFSEVAGAQGLRYGKGETAGQGDLIGAAFDTSKDAAQKVERIAKTRTGIFSGGGGFAGERSGVSGIGSASS
jgi:hypothetical protein